MTTSELKWSSREWFPATVVSARKVSYSSRELILAVPGFDIAEPGQHVDVRLTAPDGYQAVRAYSLANSGKAERVDLVVALVPDGEVSSHLVDVARPGDRVEVRGPIGGYFVWRETDESPVLLVAGGSGIVPLLSMVRARETAGSAAPFRLVYSVREPEEAVARGELEHTEGLELSWVFTRDAPPETTRPVGRLTREDLDVPGFTAADEPNVFVCGPTAFVEHAARLLRDLGHPPERIRTERFGGA